MLASLAKFDKVWSTVGELWRLTPATSLHCVGQVSSHSGHAALDLGQSSAEVRTDRPNVFRDPRSNTRIPRDVCRHIFRDAVRLRPRISGASALAQDGAPQPPPVESCATTPDLSHPRRGLPDPPILTPSCRPLAGPLSVIAVCPPPMHRPPGLCKIPPAHWKVVAKVSQIGPRAIAPDSALHMHWLSGPPRSVPNRCAPRPHHPPPRAS